MAKSWQHELIEVDFSFSRIRLDKYLKDKNKPDPPAPAPRPSAVDAKKEGDPDKEKLKGHHSKDDKKKLAEWLEHWAF